jgi:hypothetical protein
VVAARVVVEVVGHLTWLVMAEAVAWAEIPHLLVAKVEVRFLVVVQPA